MKFEYNGNETEKERVKDVSKDIMDYYEDISEGEAKVIASLEGPITDKIGLSTVFKRLFNILFVMQQNKKVSKHVLNDLIEVYENYKLKPDENENKIDKIMSSVLDYFNSTRETFPIISEFY